jgi:hypothetical protein
MPNSTSDDVASIICYLIIAVFAIMFLPLIGTLAGAFIGWIVGLVFPETILSTLARFGVRTEGLQVWQLGACLGFVGAFFKTNVTKK